ncbi:phage late control D family protein [Alteraurantiacibacter aquimixticola]|uniref:Phage late control D family protein n=1 Tax=Alteraurantiacibacter aquimixticola TaxID=2489173 RepID=A0A4T3F0D0_9SPHN|nr:hypothetical protein [Alteraurantiacibacter aquimixticola]TIX49632.1 hypothetical protein E5222_12440 [Alteraurantiacibacter aquimixticola]
MTAEIIQLSEQRNAFYAPAFEVFMFGEAPPPDVNSDSPNYPPDLSGAVRNIVEVKYEDGLERIDGFTLTVNNWDAERQVPIYFGHGEARRNASGNRIAGSREHPDVFEPGNELVLSMGYTNDTRTMVIGMVTSVDVQFAESGHSKLVVSGLNVLEKLRRQQYTWSWPDDGSADIRDSDVALLLSPPADETQHKPGLGIRVAVDEAAQGREPRVSNIFMNNQYPIVFLMQRARARGYQVVLRDSEDYDDAGNPFPELYFGPTDLEREITYVLEWGKSLVSFHPTYSNSRQLFAVKVCGWDRAAKQSIEVRKTLDDLPETDCPNRDHIAVARLANREEVIAEPPARTVAEATETALRALRQNHERMVEASGACVGLPDLRSGKTVHIRGTGWHFDGIYTVLTTSHVINEQGYRTSFTARRVNPLPPEPASGGGA